MTGCAASLATLAGLDEMTPRRLRVLCAIAPPERIIAALRATSGERALLAALRGALGSKGSRLVDRWGSTLSHRDVAAVGEAHRRAVVDLHVVDEEPVWSEHFANDPSRPALLCTRGSLASLGQRRVAIVGTRSCTRYGSDVAAELGRALAEEGVVVVSGLALGIDAAAHRGALEVDCAQPIGVVGSGLDVVYPRRSTTLWQTVGERGLLVSEHPLGVPPRPWQFLARNRIIAALGEVTVVVESHRRGGALSTAEAAAALGRPVLAVPGSVRSEASEGANALLADGAEVCRSADDVLVALGLCRSGSRPANDPGPDVEPAAGSDAGLLLDALGWEPSTFDHLVLRSGLDPSRAAVAMWELIDAELVAEQAGWIERRAR